MRTFKNRKKMRLRPDILMTWIIILVSIFGTAALIIAVIAGTDIVRGISAALLFLLGFTVAKFHNNL
jgi:lysylphosphatidylglycerol synthetase-like protein (DUF2156 family)